MGAHITYLSDAALHRKFGRKFQDRYQSDLLVRRRLRGRSYLRHQGITFVERFDANSYLYLTRAMDYFDLAADYDGVLANAFKGTPTRFCVISFTSDWLFPTSDSRAIVHALNAGSARVSFAEIVTDKGHDAFLLDEPELFAIVRGFLDSAGEARGLKKTRDAASRTKRDLTMADAARAPGGARVDHLLVAAMVEPKSRVLDVGCGDGELLRLLEQRGVDGRGIELSREGVNECVAKGLAVIQGDADTDLIDYPDDAFDYVILSQTLQATRRPREVLENMLRIGRRAIISFPNFGHWRIRLQLAARADAGDRQPAGQLVRLAEHPFLHHQGLSRALPGGGRGVEKSVALNPWGAPLRLNAPWWFWNLFGEQAVFLLTPQALIAVVHRRFIITAP